MAKIKFIGTADMSSKGINLVPGGVYEVTSAVAKYLRDTFGNVELLEEDVKEEPKPKVEAPKTGTKVSPTKK